MIVNEKINKNQQDNTEIDMFCWNDDALIRLIVGKQGDYREAFSILITRHREFIYRRCLFRLGNQHDAEDATQDIVIRVSKKLHLYQHRAQFKSWLSTVINNYCYSYAKRRARYVTTDHLQQLIEIHEAGNTSYSNTSVTGLINQTYSDPLDQLAEEELVHQSLASLPENTQQLLTLRFYAEKSLYEISQILRISLSATKARLYRAIEQLKSIYYKLEGNTTLRTLNYSA